MKETHLNVTPEAGKAFYQQKIEGKVTMLNLLKFRETADYTGYENLAPDAQITGKIAYYAYMKAVSPLIKKAGGEVLFYGKSSAFLIGPAEEKWDAVLLVRHESSAAFLAFAQDEDYQKIKGHRQAALEDSRLLPIEEGQF